MDSIVGSSPQISDRARTDLSQLFGVNGNTPDSDSGITGSNPVRAVFISVAQRTRAQRYER